MKFLIDMNLSPSWVGFFAANGVDAVHWSSVGAPGAEDTVLLSWAKTQARVLFTHDMDFAALIALAGLDGPSVLQVRTQGVLPDDIGDKVLVVVRDYAAALEEGAIVTVVEHVSRVRILPIRKRPHGGGRAG